MTKALTYFDLKPVPFRGWDWTAVTENYEEGDPVGLGHTEAEAFEDLKQQLDEEELELV